MRDVNTRSKWYSTLRTENIIEEQEFVRRLDISGMKQSGGVERLVGDVDQAHKGVKYE